MQVPQLTKGQIIMARWKKGDHWHRPSTVVPYTGNSKLSGGERSRSMSTTYKSIKHTCPKGCPMLEAGIGDDGCYGERGLVGFTTHRLDSFVGTGPEDRTPEAVARDEATQMDALRTGNKHRAQVVGDSRTPEAATITGSAMVRYERRNRAKAYTYTHAYNPKYNEGVAVLKSDWAGARVMASCHNQDDIDIATANGYGSTAVVLRERHPSNKAYRVQVLSLQVIPCPAQFKDSKVTCSECNLCQQTDLTVRGLCVGFQPDNLKKVRN